MGLMDGQDLLSKIRVEILFDKHDLKQKLLELCFLPSPVGVLAPAGSMILLKTLVTGLSGLCSAIRSFWELVKSLSFGIVICEDLTDDRINDRFYQKSESK